MVDADFAASDGAAVGQNEADMAGLLFPAPATAAQDDQGNVPDNRGRELALLRLHGKHNTLCDIMSASQSFRPTTRSASAWRDHVYGPMLRLAASGIPAVAAENIAQATIAKAFVPAARGELETL